MVRVHAALFPCKRMENMYKGELCNMAETKCGTVKWFSAKKGYGSIVFTYQDDKTKEIEITKELTNERIPTGDYVKSPKTGDDTNIWLPILLLVLSVGGIAGIFWYTKKKNHEE